MTREDALHQARQLVRPLREEARRFHPSNPEILMTHRAADVIEALLRIIGEAK
jgi:hypothetical protein